MKILIVLMLTSSIFTDFTSASIPEGESVSGCQSSISCVDVDLHTSNDGNSDSGKDGHHCHCHVGHSHNLVLSSNNTEISISNTNLYTLFPHYLLGNVQGYLSNINRPPIS